jgi:hypothetical protein
MTDHELIKAVLGSCGWKPKKDIGHGPWFTPKGEVGMTPPILTSLDACHEVFEKDAPEEYWFVLMAIANGIHTTGITIRTCKATPRQRCLAWLRFKGLPSF